MNEVRAVTKYSPSKHIRPVVAAVFSIFAIWVSDAQAAPSEFSSAEEAVNALVSAAKAEGTQEIVRVLGAEGEDIVDSGDPVADAQRRAKFIAAFDEANKLDHVSDAKTVLVIGHDEFPFPIPLVQVGGKWHWDTVAGLDEILTRRIGENELATIEVAHAYVDAQREYAAVDRDGLGPEYARRLMSRTGKKDGLYWPTSAGEDVSPLGPLVANARGEGYARSSRSDAPRAYHGYLYRILYSQGPAAEGGAQDYIVHGRMIGGFGLIALPVDYGNSGVMTFIVNDDGTVFQKDLGPETGRIAARIQTFNPDSTWTKVEPPSEN